MVPSAAWGLVQRIVSLRAAAKNGDVLVYNIATKMVAWKVDLPTTVTEVEFSPDGKRLAVASHNLTVWSFPEGKLLHRIETHYESVCRGPQLAFSPDGRYIAYLARQVRRGPMAFSTRTDDYLCLRYIDNISRRHQSRDKANSRRDQVLPGRPSHRRRHRKQASKILDVA